MDNFLVGVGVTIALLIYGISLDCTHEGQFTIPFSETFTCSIVETKD